MQPCIKFHCHELVRIWCLAIFILLHVCYKKMSLDNLGRIFELLHCSQYLKAPRHSAFLANWCSLWSQEVTYLLNLWSWSVFRQQKGRWRWADESTFNYDAWMPKQPDNYGKKEHCAELSSSTSKPTLGCSWCTRFSDQGHHENKGLFFNLELSHTWDEWSP